jgi:hypothetical protein
MIAMEGTSHLTNMYIVLENILYVIFFMGLIVIDLIYLYQFFYKYEYFVL